MMSGRSAAQGWCWGLVDGKDGREWIPPPDDWRFPQREPPENPRDALPDLWRLAARVWYEVCAIWGDSASLLRGHIPARDYRRCTDWLRHLEALVRRIVIVAALALELKPAADGRRRPWGEPRFQRTLWHDPTTWKVSFRVLRQARERREGEQCPKKPRREHDLPSRGLARRIEALRRVLSGGQAYAKRLARLLARMKTANRTLNAPREFRLRPWSIRWDKRTSGRLAVSDGMDIAQSLARRAIEVWHEPG
jgi:hypothetical protein